MKYREFNKVLNSCRVKGRLDTGKLEKLPDDTRLAMTYFIVRNRQPIVAQIIPPTIDSQWLYGMGYGYRTKGKEFEFVHTCEQHPK